MRVHEYLLQSECGYDGGQPYWDEPRDAANITASVVLDPETGFGGGGSRACVTDGPFVDLKLRFNATSATSEYCLYRSLSTRDFSSAAQSNVDKCMETTTYEDVADCLENGGPHSAGHGGVGGLVSTPQPLIAVYLFSGIPIPFLR